MSVETYVKNKQASGSNYDAALQKAAGLFSEQLEDNFTLKSGFTSDGEYIYAGLFHRNYRISRRSGRVERLDENAVFPAAYNPSMVLYDLIVYSAPDAKASGEYIQLQNHSQVHNVHSFAGEGAFDKYARLFSGHGAELERICVKLGGVPFGKGDVSQALPYFGNLRIGISFWDADDEFPPSFSVFFDKNADKFMHYETMWYAAGDLLSEIAGKL